MDNKNEVLLLCNALKKISIFIEDVKKYPLISKMPDVMMLDKIWIIWMSFAKTCKILTDFPFF